MSLLKKEQMICDVLDAYYVGILHRIFIDVIHTS